MSEKASKEPRRPTKEDWRKATHKLIKGIIGKEDITFALIHVLALEMKEEKPFGLNLFEDSRIRLRGRPSVDGDEED